jgi:hypothetical protein
MLSIRCQIVRDNAVRCRKLRRTPATPDTDAMMKLLNRRECRSQRKPRAIACALARRNTHGRED